MFSSTTEIAKLIDHAILHPTATDNDLTKECELAAKYNVASVCVKPYAVQKACELLLNSDVSVGSVIGFPSGNSSIEVKVFETTTAIKDGAVEIDMVVNIGKVLSGDWTYIEKEITAITEVCHKNTAIVKVIFETDYISKEKEIIKLCEICTKAGADFVKTSTGFGFKKDSYGNFNYLGATLEYVKLMRLHSGKHVQIKASAGIRTLDQVIEMTKAGVTRIGTSSTISILEEATQRFGK